MRFFVTIFAVVVLGVSASFLWAVEGDSGVLNGSSLCLGGGSCSIKGINGELTASYVGGTRVSGDTVCINGQCKDEWPEGVTSSDWERISRTAFNQATDTLGVHGNKNGNALWTTITILEIRNRDIFGGDPFDWRTITLEQPILGLRIRAVGSNPGVCAVYVEDLFAANYVLYGNMLNQTLDSWKSGEPSPAITINRRRINGALERSVGFVFEEGMRSGTYMNAGSHDNELGALKSTWGYVRPYGLRMIPPGATLRLMTGMSQAANSRFDGVYDHFVLCSVDVLQAHNPSKKVIL